MSGQVRVFCMSKTRGHRKKGVFVGAFNPPMDEGGDWEAAPITSAYLREKHTAPGENTPSYAGWVHDGDSPRFVHTLACPICAPGKTPLTQEWETTAKGVVELRQETLNALMGGLRHAGHSEISLHWLQRANMLSRSNVI